MINAYLTIPSSDPQAPRTTYSTSGVRPLQRRIKSSEENPLRILDLQYPNRLAECFNNPVLSTLFDSLPESAKGSHTGLTIAWTESKPISLRNHTVFMTNLDLNKARNVDIDAPCPICSQFSTDLIDPRTKHVAAPVHMFLPEGPGKRLAAQGLKSHAISRLESRPIWQCFQQIADQLLTRAVKSDEFDRTSFDRTVKRARSLLHEQLRSQRFAMQQSNVASFSDDAKLGKQQIADLSASGIYINGVDKGSSTAYGQCERSISRATLDRFESESAFTLSTLTPDEAVDKCVSICKELELETLEEESKLPFLYPLLKVVKPVEEYRWITSTTGSALRPLERWVAGVQRAVIDVVHAQCLKRSTEMFRNSGTTTRFDIRANSSTEVIINMPDKVFSVIHLDFKKLYERIRHSSFLPILRKMWDRASRHGMLCFESDNSIYWATSPRKDHHRRVPFKLFSDRFIILLRNVMIRVGQSVYTQDVGFPMGSLISADSASGIVLNSWELDAIEANLPTVFDLAAGRGFKFGTMFRVMDDILIVNCPSFMSRFASLIYPISGEDPLIELNDETIEYQELNSLFYGINVHFCDLDIRCNPITGEWSVKLFDKAVEKNIPRLRFEQWNSNTPCSTLLGTFKSQLCRFAIVNSSENGFIRDSVNLFRLLSSKGYPERKLRQTFWDLMGAWSSFAVGLRLTVDPTRCFETANTFFKNPELIPPEQ